MDVQEADHILIPLLNGDYTLAQVVRTDDDGTTLLYVTQRTMKLTSEVFAIGNKDIKAAVFTKLETVPYGHWPIVGYEEIPDLKHGDPSTMSDNDRQVHDPETIEAFANALHGLYPWDGFPDPDFFANMLITPENMPKKARLKADLATKGTNLTA